MGEKDELEAANPVSRRSAIATLTALLGVVLVSYLLMASAMMARTSGILRQIRERPYLLLVALGFYFLVVSPRRFWQILKLSGGRSMPVRVALLVVLVSPVFLFLLLVLAK